MNVKKLAMMPIPTDKAELVKLLKKLDDTQFVWAGSKSKPSGYTPAPLTGLMGAQKYIFFYSDLDMTTGTDIHFRSNGRPPEVKSFTELISLLLNCDC